MRYSVWNQGAKQYDYFETPEVVAKANAPKPSLPTGKIGVTPEQAAWPLPKDAKRVGQGPLPQGRIASPEGARGIGPLGYAVLGGLGYALWRRWAK